MLCLDVNVLLHGLNEESAEHERVAAWLGAAANGSEPVGIPDVVGLGFVRVITNRRIFDRPTSPSIAWAALDALRKAPAIQPLSAGPGHLSAFRSLCDQIDAQGNDLTDAFIAAYALENNATLVSDDRGFRRFDGLEWQRPAID